MARIFAGASKIVCNSRFLENYVASQFPRHRPKLLTIYNGVEFDRYSSGRRIEIPGVKPGELTLLCVTALNFENKSKGLELVLDAFEAVREHRSDVKLVVAAKAGIERYAQQARTALASRRCRDSVILLFNRRDVPDLLASSDVFVYATPENSNDSLPRALLEAQSAGVPVVTTGTTGCAEIVLEDKTGFVTPYDSAAMAKRVLKLLNDPDLRRRLGEQAKQWIRCRFTWDQMASAYAEVFLEVARPSASHSGDARSLERQFT